MKLNLAAWFPAVWKSDAMVALAEYQDIGHTRRFFLADVALRGFVYVDAPPARDLFEAGVHEGMRRLALGIINTARAPHDDLRALIAAAQKGGSK